MHHRALTITLLSTLSSFGACGDDKDTTTDATTTTDTVSTADGDATSASDTTAPIDVADTSAPDDTAAPTCELPESLAPICNVMDLCVEWTLLDTNFDTPGEVQLTWRVYSDCPAPVTAVSLAGDPPLTFLHADDGSTYTSPGSNTYTRHLNDGPCGALTFTAQGAGISGGDDTFVVTIARDSITSETVLFNYPTVASDDNGYAVLASKCFTLPAE